MLAPILLWASVDPHRVGTVGPALPALPIRLLPAPRYVPLPSLPRPGPMPLGSVHRIRSNRHSGQAWSCGRQQSGPLTQASRTKSAARFLCLQHRRGLPGRKPGLPSVEGRMEQQPVISASHAVFCA